MKYIIVETTPKKKQIWHEFDSEEEQLKTFNQWRENTNKYGGCSGMCDCWWSNGDSFGFCFGHRFDLLRQLSMAS